MRRFFLEPEAWDDDAALTGEEARHCARVIRASVGDRIEVFDGRGRSAEASVQALGRHQVDLRLGVIKTEPEPPVRVTLVMAVIKSKAMDLLLQKAVELGVWEIQPVKTDHGVVEVREGKEDRWRKTVLEACKQCGRNRVPSVRGVISLASALAGTPGPSMIYGSLGRSSRPLREIFDAFDHPRYLSFCIGPEGDFSAAEIEALDGAGAAAASLGPNVLRSETAAIYCLAAAACRWS